MKPVSSFEFRFIAAKNILSRKPKCTSNLDDKNYKALGSKRCNINLVQQGATVIPTFNSRSGAMIEQIDVNI